MDTRGVTFVKQILDKHTIKTTSKQPKKNHKTTSKLPKKCVGINLTPPSLSSVMSRRRPNKNYPKTFGFGLGPSPPPFGQCPKGSIFFLRIASLSKLIRKSFLKLIKEAVCVDCLLFLVCLPSCSPGRAAWPGRWAAGMSRLATSSLG